MPKLKPVKLWAIVEFDGECNWWVLKDNRKRIRWMAKAYRESRTVRVARVEIREIARKGKRHG